MFNKYLNYIKDNPNQYWFKRKLFGWGWTPATWEGWLTTALFLMYVYWETSKLPANNEEITSNILSMYYFKFIMALIILLLICYLKGEKPKWQWGLPKEK